MINTSFRNKKPKHARDTEKKETFNNGEWEQAISEVIEKVENMLPQVFAASRNACTIPDHFYHCAGSFLYFTKSGECICVSNE